MQTKAASALTVSPRAPTLGGVSTAFLTQAIITEGRAGSSQRIFHRVQPSFRLEFFANAVCDPTGFGEGEVFLGALDPVLTDASGNANLNFSFPTVAGKLFITVTATNNATGDTSEFSACTPVALKLDVALTDPAVCVVPGGVIAVQATVTNTSLVTSSFTFTAALPATLIGLAGSCTVSGNLNSSCNLSASQVGFTGTVGAGQTVTLNYRVQVADGTATGTSLCTTSTVGSGSALIATVTTCATINCPVVGPGLLFPSTAEVSDQKAGSVLVYNLYSSSSATPNTQNTRVSITNTHPRLPIAVHLFFVDGATCSIADNLVCLTPNQTASFLASDIDPGTTGYLVAVASDRVTGCPVDFNYLIGDEYVKLASNHAANLTAEGIAASAGGLPACDVFSVTAELSFNGVSYNRVPRVLAASNIPSRADGNDTLLVLNRFGGNLAVGAATLTGVFGILYDDAENPISFTFNPGLCQFRSNLSNSFPRTAPRFEQFIPAGRSGWLKIYSLNDQGLFGAQLNFNPNAGTSAGAFNQGHNLHKLTLTPTVVLTIPIFPPNC